QRMYFSGFWEKYTLQVTICNPNDSVYLNPPDNIWKPCYSFFNDLLNRHGVKLVNSPFYYLDNLNGQISYFGWFGYSSVKKPFEITLFIELDTKLIAEQLGYPELLLDSKMSKPSALNEYSYAKYYNNGLIMQSGAFPYSLTTEPYPKSKSEYTFVTFDNYDHLIYKIDKKNTIVLSKASFRFFDALVSFTYIFVFFFTLITLVILFTNFPLLKQSFRPNFKNKIQLTMISVLSLSLFFVGGGTIYFSVQQYKNKVQELIHEKIQSVNSELLPNIGGENKLTADWYSNQYDNLNELLSKLSNVFYTDINLYDTQGNLLATSRPEIFEKGLIGTKINAAAYQQLIEKKKAEFVHNENIGKLQYLSAYVPFMNKGNKVLGYLNLPYFTQQDALSREISSLIVTIANIYVLLLLLSTSLAVFVSNKITFPLRIIQNKLGQVDLAKKNEPIVYNQKDEIGSLVKEYNHMLEELRNSAEILAKSERESAWREMAKQVAHEINNPLTPMKLSVQHLQRAWKDGIPNWDEQLQRFSKTLIEQIDTLSSIATEFSNFAKMPQSNYETFDLIPKIKTCVSLFENTENVIFEVNTHENKDAMIYADQEQISRVFNNLIKNAIQAFPTNFKGTIKIDLSKNQEKVIVKVQDNGKGIPKEVGEKMFQPNFTTKSSGMGLGLAIVKNTIENVQGKIDYETQQGIGTTFIIVLPLIAS
ncbi:MAG: ATP-binding protein, partial [Bacteroidota bacterium]|nr:ATP-binding protein [Bacteroidota bacterium]